MTSGDTGLGRHRVRLWRDLGVMLTRIGGALTQLAAVAVIAALLGPRVLGTYLLFQSATRLTGVAISFGDPWFVMREVSKFDLVGNPRASEVALRTSLRRVGRVCAALVAAGFGVIVVARASGLVVGGTSLVLIAALVTIGATARTAVVVDGLKARHRQLTALFLEFSVPPLAAMASAPICSGRSPEVAVLWVVGLYTAGTVLAAALAAGAWRRSQRRARDASLEAGREQDGVAAERPPDSRGSRRAFGVTIVVQMAAQTLPLVVLPMVLSLEDVGRMGAALRITAIPGTIGMGLGSVYGPQFSRLWVAADEPGLRAALRVTQLWTVALFAPFGVAFLVAPGWVVALLGEGFVGIDAVVRVLAVGQVANALTGQAPILLSMCRDERFAMQATVLTVSGGIIGLVLGGAWWGLAGAAAAHASMITMRNVTVWVRAVRFVIPRAAVRPGP